MPAENGNHGEGELDPLRAFQSSLRYLLALSAYAFAKPAAILKALCSLLQSVGEQLYLPMLASDRAFARPKRSLVVITSRGGMACTNYPFGAFVHSARKY